LNEWFIDFEVPTRTWTEMNNKFQFPLVAFSIPIFASKTSFYDKVIFFFYYGVIHFKNFSFQMRVSKSAWGYHLKVALLNYFMLYSWDSNDRCLYDVERKGDSWRYYYY